MNLYPAIKGKMGTWQYYMVKMSMRELADSVKFASNIHDDRTLDEAIQRVLNESRIKKDIVSYLFRQPDRFFSSIVVAALGGKPKWYPVSITEDERFVVFRDDERLNETFGLLVFEGTQNYYALDGQHRLAAIKALIDPGSDSSFNAPEGFINEEISVIVVVPTESDSNEEFLKRYRRLFGNLNRYAKPTDAVTNIIMDEDDAFAIITRRLITEHEFFQYRGRQKESKRVKTEKGKNLKSTDTYFTSLETLYSMNISLLSSRKRINEGWNKQGVKNHKEFQKYRPEEELLDSLFDELKVYWNALIDELPELENAPDSMRNHSALSESNDSQDHVLFWPIGQELLAEITRDLLDFRLDDPENLTIESAKNAILGLNKLNWNFGEAPWRNLLLIPPSGDDGRSNWRIRSEDRKTATNIAKWIIRWQLGIDELDDNGVSTLRTHWEGMLLPALDDAEIEELWSKITDATIR